MEEKEGWRLRDQPKSRGLTRVVALNRLSVPSRLLLSLSNVHNHTHGPTGCETPFLAVPNMIREVLARIER